MTVNWTRSAFLYSEYLYATFSLKYYIHFSCLLCQLTLYSCDYSSPVSTISLHRFVYLYCGLSCVLYVDVAQQKWPSRDEKLTRSLLSGSEKLLSEGSESRGGNCGTAPISKPYMLRSAADATSAAIDYSKGDVEEGVVDSPPSRGPIRTPICSPSPLKRTLSTRGVTFSPALRTEGTTSRKLDLLVADVVGHPRFEDDAVHPPERGTCLADG